MKKIVSVRLGLGVILLGLSMAFTGSAVGNTLTTGYFSCSVMVIEPPSGTGEPEGGAVMSFNQVLGMVGGPASVYIELGTGSELEGNCQELAGNTFSLAQDQGCTVSAIQNVQFQGGNYFENRWSFDVLCAGRQNKVVNSINAILKGVMTTPVAVQQTIQKRNSEIRANNTDTNKLR